MIEKALIIIVFMYAVSFSLLGGEYVMSVFGITMVNMDGDPINSELLQIIDSDEINRTTTNLNNINGTTAESDPVGTAAGLVVDIIQLLTGTYIFNLLFLFGVPAIFVYGLTTLYAFMLFRALIGYLRGI